MRYSKKSILWGTMAVVSALLITLVVSFGGFSGIRLREVLAYSATKVMEAKRSHNETPQHTSGDPLSAQSVELSGLEIERFKVQPVEEHDFTAQRSAVGNIDFNQEMLVQVFPPVQGKIITLFASVGDAVKKGDPLYTIDSPDLAQAGSSLIAAAGVFNLTSHVLERDRKLREVEAIPQKELDQAISDHQAADGAFKAAREAVRIFGKSNSEMDHMIAQRKIDTVLLVRSPITGRVTLRNAAPGLLVQPGTAPAPYTLADVSSVWMLANVAETDFPFLKLGEDVDVSVKAYPDSVFHGKIVRIGESVDPVTHRILVRSEVHDPKHELRPGMFATFVIRTGSDIRSPAVPFNGVVREGDGSMTVWVTTDSKRMVKRTIKLGLQQNGYAQILEGLNLGELVATEGAIFLSNALTESLR